jgi:hypothetical protein
MERLNTMMPSIVALTLTLIFLSASAAVAEEAPDFPPNWSLMADRLEQQGVVGWFVERIPGSYVLVSENRELPAVKILNPERIASVSVGVRLSVRGIYAPEKSGVRVTDYSFAGSQPMAMPRIIGGLANSPVARTLTAFRKEVDRAMKPGAMSADIISREDNSTFTRAAEKTKRELRQVYRKAQERGPAGSNDRDQAVRGFAAVRKELKAIYGDYDNYPPWSYQQIFTNAQSVVAIARRGQTKQALCSGVLIAEDLVLTAGHCFKNDIPRDLDVWFGFTESKDGIKPGRVVRPIIELVAPPPEMRDEFLRRASEERFDADMLDYAIVRIGPGQGDPSDSAVEPQCLRRYNIRRGQPIYVIGYPKGYSEKVHDNGRVYLQFRLRPRELKDLQLDIEADFVDHEDRQELMEEFVKSYVQKGTGADLAYELYDPRWGGQPKIGIVADLFRGNSGSPVFDRTNHCIVGIHTGGVSDTGQRLGVSWQNHETVLPITAILADLKEQPTTSPLVDAGILTME